MFQRLYAIALTTFIETVRQPIFGVILITTALMLVLNVSLAAFTLDDDNKLLLDLGLSTLLMSGLFLSAFSASSVLSREIENKTVLTVISKPVSRTVFILGKFAGLTAALGIAYYICTLVFILTIRHGVLENTSDPWDAPVLTFGFGSVGLAMLIAGVANFLYGRDFPTTALAAITPLLTISVLLIGKFDEGWNVIPFGTNYVGGQVLIAAYFVLLLVMLTAAIALAASTRLGQLMTLVVCTGVLSLGIISDYALGQYADTSLIARLAYYIVPNVGPFWIVDALRSGTEKTLVTLDYIAYVTAYAALFTTAAIAIAIVAFQKREVG